MLFFFLSKCISFIYLFIGCVVSSLLCRLSLVAASRGYSLLRCAGFLLQWLLFCRAQALGVRASVVVAHGLSSCGA